MALKVQVIPVTPFQQNCSLLICDDTRKAAIVDPGGDLEQLLDAIKASGGELEKILVTHGHIDHCGGAARLRELTGAPIEGPQEEDRFWIEQLPAQGVRFGFDDVRAFEPDRWLADGDTASFGRISLAVRHCPGHTPGHVVFFAARERLAIVGDVLFAGSIGRTDFPRGDFDTLIHSITTRLWTLGGDVTFIPGHGPASTFAEERETNPFVSDRVLAGEATRSGRARYV